MEYETIEASLCVLKRVSATPKLTERFAGDERLREALGMYNVPSHELLEDYLTGEELMIWRVIPTGAEDDIGLAGFAAHDGPPYVFFHWNNESQYNLQLAQDVFQQIVPPYFRNTEEPRLFLYENVPVDPEAHAALVEAGFDPFEDCPSIDSSQETAYVLERHTYDAYYGEDDEGSLYEDYEEPY